MNQKKANLRPLITQYIIQARAGNQADARALFIQAKTKLKQEQKTMSKPNTDSFDDEPADDGGPKTKKPRRTTTSTKTNTIPLTGDQLTKLWAIVMGGPLVIDDDPEAGETIYHVGLDSFSKALPVLLEKL